jgi:hypothetical protein
MLPQTTAGAPAQALRVRFAVPYCFAKGGIMLTIQVLLAAAIVVNLLWPTLPVSRSMTAALLRFAGWVQRNATLGRALLGISAALLLFTAIWALQGDAPMFLAMILPELAGWFATFEIATLVEAMVGVGTILLTARIAGFRTILRGKASQRRRRSRTATRSKAPANDEDGHGVLALAA